MIYYLATKKASMILKSKQPGDQQLLVLSEGLGNEESHFKVPCTLA